MGIKNKNKNKAVGMKISKLTLKKYKCIEERNRSGAIVRILAGPKHFFVSSHSYLFSFINQSICYCYQSVDYNTISLFQLHFTLC